MLQIRNLRKSFGDLQVLKSIDLDVNKGDVVAILGPSGSGKTTMLRCLNFLEKSDGGTSVRVETDAQTGQSIEMDVPDASGHEGIYNILLVGTDGDSTRTDTLLIANLNTKEHTVSLMSIRATLISPAITSFRRSIPSTVRRARVTAVSVR